MYKKILRIAKLKFKKLFENYRYFNVVFVDNWRGFRFVYDTDEIKKYSANKFYKSQLYYLLGKERYVGKFSIGLHPANKADKRLFGPEIFLNCKTYKQYQNCYINFLLKKKLTYKQIIEELELIKNLKIIYSKTGSKKGLERKFRLAVIEKVLVKANKSKREAILSYLKRNRGFFDG
jgi:hypothetical protein